MCASCACSWSNPPPRARALIAAANYSPKPYLLLPASALLGFGASALWVGQGDYVTWAAKEYALARSEPLGSAIGLFNGIFYCIFQSSQVSGNLVGGFVLSSGSGSNCHAPAGNATNTTGGGGNSTAGGDAGGSISQSAVTTLFAVFMSCAAAGVVLMATIRPKALSSAAANEHEAALLADGVSAGAPKQRSEEEPVSTKLLATMRLSVQPRMALAIPMIMYNGLEMSCAWGFFTANIIRPSLGASNIGFVMAVFGFANAAGSAGVGRLSDRVGLLPVFCSGLAAQGALFVFLLTRTAFHDFGWTPLMVMAFVWGYGDAVQNTMLSALMGSAYGRDTDAAFSNFKMFQSLTVTALFFTQSLLQGDCPDSAYCGVPVPECKKQFVYKMIYALLSLGAVAGACYALGNHWFWKKQSTTAAVRGRGNSGPKNKV